MKDCKENASFERCVGVLVRLIEKYGNGGEDTYTDNSVEEEVDE
jgi:hypothetical protein